MEFMVFMLVFWLVWDLPVEAPAVGVIGVEVAEVGVIGVEGTAAVDVPAVAALAAAALRSVSAWRRARLM